MEPLNRSRSAAVASALIVLGLWSFAVAQPALDLLNRYPEFLIAHRVSGAQVFSVALLLSFLLALPLLILSVGFHYHSHRVGSWAEQGLIALLAAIGLLPALRPLGPWGAGLALLAGIGLALAQRKLRWIRSLLVASSLAAPVFLVLFLAQPEIRKLWRPTSVSEQRLEALETPITVTMIVYDALPLSTLLDADGEIDAGAFPNFARLAEEGIWFKNATTSADFTVRSVPAMLTGIRPAWGQRPTLAYHPDNLFSLLRSTHEIVATEAITRLCDPDWSTVLPRQRFELVAFLRDLSVLLLHSWTPTPWSDGLPEIEHGWRDFAVGLGQDTQTPQDRALEEHARFISAIQPATQPRFYFEHIIYPHEPYRVYPSGKRYGDGIEPGGVRGRLDHRVDDAWAALHSYQRHILQVGHADLLLGEVIDRLERAGQYEDGLVIAVADHGIGFRPGEYLRHLRRENAHEIMPVPLLVKLPHGERSGTVSMRNVETVDIPATVADILGIELPWRHASQSMLDSTLAERPHKLCLGRRESNNQSKFPGGFMVKQMETVRFKLEQFGSGAEPERIFRVSDEWGLYGEAIDGYEIVDDPALGLNLHTPARVEVESGDSYLPLEVVGYARGSEAELAELRIAVAVNGRVAALTRPYRIWDGGELAAWAALVSERAIRVGENRFEMFAVEDLGDRVRLLRPTHDDEPSYLGVSLGRVARVGIVEEGLGRRLGYETRWSDGHAKLVVPLRADDEPKAVRIFIPTTGRGGSQIRLRVDGMELLDEFVDQVNWTKTVPLTGSYSDELTLELISDGHERRERETGKPQGRWTSIAIGGIWLLGESER